MGLLGAALIGLALAILYVDYLSKKKDPPTGCL